MSEPPQQPPPPGYPPPGYPPPNYPAPFQLPPPRRGMPPFVLALLILAGCGVLGLMGVAVLGAVMFPVFAQAREKARASACRSNAKILSTALMMYALDYDEHFPPAARWQDAVLPHHKTPSAERCPKMTGPGGYAFNIRLSGRSLARVPSAANQPALFDSIAAARNSADALQSFAPRHPQGGTSMGIVAYADGSVRFLAAAPPAGAGLKELR